MCNTVQTDKAENRPRYLFKAPYHTETLEKEETHHQGAFPQVRCYPLQVDALPGELLGRDEDRSMGWRWTKKETNGRYNKTHVKTKKKGGKG